MEGKLESDLETLFRAPLSAQPASIQSEGDASSQIQQLVCGFWSARALYAVVKLGIVDWLDFGLRHSKELALVTETDAPSLYRLLHALVSIGLFQEGPKDTFFLTPLSLKLRSEDPDSLRSLILTELGEDRYQLWGDIVPQLQAKRGAQRTRSARVSKAPRLYQDDLCSDQGLGSIAARVQAAVLEAYDFSSVGTLVDVGGGDGTFLAFLLQAYPALRGVLVEQPQVSETACRRLEAEGVRHRCKVVARDFFEFLPRHGDVYVLKWVIRHYEDVQAVHILTNCRRAMAPTGKVLLIDTVAPAENASSFCHLQDVNRLVSARSQERSVDEFAALMREAGLHVSRVLPTCPEASIIEAVR